MKLFRKDIEIEPAVKRELDAIDAALAGEHTEPQLEELTRLATELRQDRPVPRELFTAELDRRVADGFPPKRTSEDEPRTSGGFERPSWLSWRALAPATAAVASLAVITTAVVSSGVFSDGTQPAPVGGDGAPVATSIEERPKAQKFGSEAQEDAPPATAAQPAPGTSAAPDSSALKFQRTSPSGGAGSDAIARRQVETAVSLVLATSADDVEDTSDGVVRVTDKYRGFVSSSEVTGGDAANAGATFVLRIPSDKVQDALADLSELGHVRERTQSTDDITSEFVTVRSQISRATSERKALLKQLAAADTPNETAAAKARLRGVDRRLAGLRAQQKRLNNRVSYSTVDVRVQADSNAGSGDGKFTPSDALDDARDILGAGIGVLLIALALLLPLAALGAGIWFGARAIGRRSRERALDASDDR